MCKVDNEVENVKKINENVLEYVPKDAKGERVTKTEIVLENELKIEMAIEVNDSCLPYRYIFLFHEYCCWNLLNYLCN